MTTAAKYKEEANADPKPAPNYVSVIYGDYGKRKTSTACSMSKERGLLLCSDDSWKVLLNPRHRTLAARIKVINLQGLKQLEYVDFTGYDTIIWDTISRSVGDYLNVLHSNAKWGGNHRATLQVDKKGLHPFEVPDVTDNLAPIDYLACKNAFEPVLNELFKLDAQIIFTSQMTEPIQGLSKDQRARPKVSDATFQLIGERSDIIGMMKPGNAGKFYVDMSENVTTMLGKSRIEGLQGQMLLDDFITKYKEIAFK